MSDGNHSLIQSTSFRLIGRKSLKTAAKLIRNSARKWIQDVKVGNLIKRANETTDRCSVLRRGLMWTVISRASRGFLRLLIHAKLFFPFTIFSSKTQNRRHSPRKLIKTDFRTQSTKQIRQSYYDSYAAKSLAKQSSSWFLMIVCARTANKYEMIWY